MWKKLKAAGLSENPLHVPGTVAVINPLLEGESQVVTTVRSVSDVHELGLLTVTVDEFYWKSRPCSLLIHDGKKWEIQCPTLGSIEVSPRFILV